MSFTYRYKKYIVVGVVFILLLSCSGYFIFKSLGRKEVKTKPVALVSKRKEKPVLEETLLKVDIKGEVINPGIYSLNSNSRVIDVINMAGGLKDTADTSVINLSKKIKDEMVIIIYSYNEVKDFSKTKEKEKTVLSKCSEGGEYDLINDACIDKSEEEVSLAKASISINTATAEQLDSLPGIGEAKAKTIISYREENGGFKTIEDIMNVSGIGESLFAKIKDFITT